MLYKPHNYQSNCIDHIINHTHCGLFIEMGLGKSSITLTALEYLHNTFEVKKTLIIAPKRVAEHTWTSEHVKWDHLDSLTVSRIIGNEKQRIAAFHTPADIYVISRDNIAWLVDWCQRVLKKWPFDCLVVDESSSFKNRASQRFKALRKILPKLRRTIILTGTPAAQSLLDLWPQVYLLDQGERLGRTFTGYKDAYFRATAQNGHIVFKYELKEGAESVIHDKIKDICLSMTAKDYLDLPERIDVVESVELDNFDRYLEFKKTETMTLRNGEELTPVNAASLYSHLLQFCNGAVYTSEDKNYEVVDNTKLEALAEDVEALNGSPVLIFYQFISDKERILKKIPQARVFEKINQIDEWNRGEIPVLLLHGMSAGHGLNMQEGGNHIFWYGLPWSLEIYMQSNARIHRQGLMKPVTIKHFIAKGTVEEVVLSRLGDKTMTQDRLIEALKRYLL